MKGRHRMRVAALLTFCLLILAGACGNPEIKHYLIRMPGADINPGRDSLSIGTTGPEKEKKEKKKAETLLQEKMLIFQDEKLIIHMSTADGETLDELAEKLGIYPNQRYYRMPGLSYFRFEVETRGDQSLELDFFKASFSDEFGENYLPLSGADYRGKYTSASYNRFDYDFIYSFYVTEKNGKTSEEEEFYLAKTLPGRPVRIQGKVKAFQIVPFAMFSSGSRTYLFKLSLYGGTREVKIPFYYRAVRADEEKAFLNEVDH